MRWRHCRSSRKLPPALGAPARRSSVTLLATMVGRPSGAAASACPAASLSEMRFRVRPSAVSASTAKSRSTGWGTAARRMTSAPSCCAGARSSGADAGARASVTVPALAKARRNPVSPLGASMPSSTKRTDVSARCHPSSARLSRARSGGQGSAVSAASRASALRALMGPAMSGARPSTPAAVASRATGRPARSASVMAARAVVTLSAQSVAEAQPLSSTTSKGPVLFPPARGLRIGPARPRMRQASARMRRISSQGGVRSGDCVVVSRSASRRSAGKTCVRGAGGLARSSHQSRGRMRKASNAQGSAKIIDWPRLHTAPEEPHSEPGRCDGAPPSSRRRRRWHPGPQFVPAGASDNPGGWSPPWE